LEKAKQVKHGLRTFVIFSSLHWSKVLSLIGEIPAIVAH